MAQTRRNVLAAALDILRGEGWDALTQTRVAERAGVGRATVYRHWPNVSDLLFDALSEAELTDHTIPTGDLQHDLIDELFAFSRSMGTGQTGRIMTALIDRAEWDDDLAAIRRRLASNGTSVLQRILRTARNRGDLPATGDDQLLITQLVGPLTFRRFFTGRPITKRFVTDVVDQVLRAARADLPR
ncbi:MAG: TetR/AcrR family transcriptional regulator [Acidimicrobiales bacterium]|nr:TetR/AcrR family transcriptional regulator [Acidimicrobiales bacterium]